MSAVEEVANTSAVDVEGSMDHEDKSVVADTSPSSGVKKRWRRNRVACDACHVRRVRCDRAFPCSRCVASQTQCEVTRERRKRGRIPRHDLLRRDSAFARETKTGDQDFMSGKRSTVAHQTDFISMVTDPLPTDQMPPHSSNFARSAPTSPEQVMHASAAGSGEHLSHRTTIQQSPKGTVGEGQRAVEDWMSGSNGPPQGPYPYSAFENMAFSDAFFDIPLGMLGLNNLNGYQLSRSVSRQQRKNDQPGRPTEPPLKYPVLAPLMPFLEPYLSRSLVYDLLDLYFTSAFSTAMHPVCHHIHCYVVRKASFLSREAPRPTSPALLASMLWVAALDDRAFALSISPPKRKKLCQFLCALTVRLLRPLIHVSFKDDDALPIIDQENSFPLGGHDRTRTFEEGGDDRGLIGPAGSLDDVITYIHVASIISASEQKAASMRWCRTSPDRISCAFSLLIICLTGGMPLSH